MHSLHLRTGELHAILSSVYINYLQFSKENLCPLPHLFIYLILYIDLYS